MATVRCKRCQNLVAFRGMAAACPQCGQSLRVPGPRELLDVGESADASVGPSVPTMVAEYGRAEPGGTRGRKQELNKGMIIAMLGGVAVLVLALGLWAIYAALSGPSKPPPTAPPVAPVVVIPTPKPVPVVPVKPPDPAPPPTTVPTPPPVVRERTWEPIRPAAPQSDVRGAVTQAKLLAAVRRGADYLLSNFDGPFLKPEVAKQLGGRAVGADALAVYALLTAGRELKDPDLDVRSQHMRDMIEALKTANPAGDAEVYTRSLRIQALASVNRPEDRLAIENDLKYLLRVNISGAFTYREPPPGTQFANFSWDGSNSQYGLLGVWAASMAGYQTPTVFWQQVEQFWLTHADGNGGWGYHSDNPTMTMTCAGVNALMVAADQLLLDPGTRPRDPLAGRTAALRGLDFLSKDNRIPRFNEIGHYGYAVYGVERVGLATGYKYIGEVDWFRTLAARLLQEQKREGDWPANDSDVVDASFCVLFLARGQAPVMMAKLRYDGTWQKSPRDLANLSIFGSQKTERALNWQTVDLKRSWRDWMDAPVVLITGGDAIDLTDDDVANLRSYVAHGGMIFTHADNGKEAFNAFASELAAKVQPGGKLEPLGPDHPIYSMVLRPKPAPPLLGMSNGNRLVWIHSPADLTGRWLRRVGPGSQQNLETGLNVFIYAAGKAFTRNRVDTPVLPPPVDPPVGTLPLARITFDGAWDPEPAAWPRIAQDFELSTRIHVEIKNLRATDLPSPVDLPVAVLTSTGEIALGFDEVKAVRSWVERGGTLIVDACGGSRKASAGVATVLPAILGGPVGQPIPTGNALLGGAGYGDFGRDVSKTLVTDYTLGERGGRNPPPRMTRVGKGLVISSDLDLTTALLETGVWGISGYTGDWTRGFVYNTLLSVANGTPGQSGPNPKANQ